MCVMDTKVVSKQIQELDLPEYLRSVIPSIDPNLKNTRQDLEPLINDVFTKIAYGEIKTPIPCEEPLNIYELFLKKAGVDISVPSFSFSDFKLDQKKLPKKINLNDYDFSSNILGNQKISVPAVPANMQCVVNFQLIKECIRRNVPVINHRYFKVEKQLELLQKVKNEFKDEYNSPNPPKLYAACGTKEDQEGDVLKEVLKLLEAGYDGVCIDITHGASYPVMKLCEQIKEKFPEKKVIIGNVCNYEDAIRAARAGADAIKVGMGPGSPCTTRDVTGVGEPQLSSIMMASLVAKEIGLDVLGDGGILDAGLACAAGSDLNMYGQMFCKTLESLTGREIQDFRYNSQTHQFEVLYFGEASSMAHERRVGALTEGTVPEGDSRWVPVDYSLDELLNEFKTQIAKLLKALNLKSLEELKAHVREKGFSEIINFMEDDTIEHYNELLKQREIAREEGVKLLDKVQEYKIEFNYLGANELNSETNNKISDLINNISKHGPRVGINVPELKSSAQFLFETEHSHPNIENLAMKDICLSPRYADINTCSRRFAKTNSRLTQNIKMKFPYIPSNKSWVLDDSARNEYVNDGNTLIIQEYNSVEEVNDIISINPKKFIPTISSTKNNAYENAIDLLGMDIAGINIEIINGDVESAIKLCEKLKAYKPETEIIISGVTGFNDALQAIVAGASGLKVNIEENGATKIASTFAAAKEFDIPIIAEADWIGTKDANTAIALGASCISESRIAFKASKDKNEYEGNAKLGTNNDYADVDVNEKISLIKQYEQVTKSLKSSLTLQGVTSIDDLHIDPRVRIVSMGYHHEVSTRTYVRISNA